MYLNQMRYIQTKLLDAKLCEALVTRNMKGKIVDTEIAVRTSVGESKTEIVKNSLGQGSFGAALASSLNIGCAVQDAFKGKKSTSTKFPHTAR